MAKKDLTVTEAGTFVYPHLTTPDTKYDTDGVYHVKLNLPVSGRTELIKEAIDDAAAEALAVAKKENVGKKTEKGKKPPNLELCDDMPYTEEEDGTITFSFKMKASGVTKEGKPWTRKPALFDSKGVPITSPSIKIGGGTLGKVSFELSSFYQAKLGAGVTLRMYGAQILRLVEWGGFDAASLGFGVEEDGFSADELAPDNEFTAAAENDAEDDNNFTETLTGGLIHDASASDEF